MGISFWDRGLSWPWPIYVATAILAVSLIVTIAYILLKWGGYWLLAFVSDAKISMTSLIVMSFLKLDPAALINAKIMVRQAGLSIDSEQGGMSTDRMQAHVLAGGNLKRVVQAIIAAERAGISLDFEHAAAIDLSGRDVLLGVQSNIFPRVIRCPIDIGDGHAQLSAIAKNGVELLVSARITVRTNMLQLVGGANEETIIARVGQGIIAAIGSADSHSEILADPSLISKAVMERGLESNTAYAIVSIDIADIAVGANIGASLMALQADADSRVARAGAEVRRAEAVAKTQQMIAVVKERQAEYVLAQALIPPGLSEAYRCGNIRTQTGPARFLG